MHIKGPNWKKIWKRQKEFLHHKSEQQKDLYCGRTLKDWCLILLCVTIFWASVAAFAVGCFALFWVMIIVPSGDVPYRKGYIFGNEKIEKEYKNAYKLAQETQKELDAKTPMSQITMSHLDFPLLSVLPKRYDGQDEAPGHSRDLEYGKQMKKFYTQLLDKSQSNSTKKGQQAIHLKDCSGANFGTDRTEGGKNDQLLLNTACKVPDEVMTVLQECHKREWGIVMPQESLEGKPGDAHSPEGFQICLIIKLNKIVGFIPVPWRGDNLKKVFKDTVTKNTTQVFAFPGQGEIEKVVEGNEYKLPLSCWLGIDPRHDDSKKHKSELEYFFGVKPDKKPAKDAKEEKPENKGNNTKEEKPENKEDNPKEEKPENKENNTVIAVERQGKDNDTNGKKTTYKSFIEFEPGPYIDLRQYPFMGNKRQPTIPTIIKVNFNNNIKPQDVVTLDCRVYAKNIPYKYRMDITPANHFGHIRVRMKYYYDKNINRNYWKLEK